MKLLQIAKHLYHKVYPLLQTNKGNCPSFAYSVVDNYIDGMVFVDQVEEPKTLMIGTDSGIYYIMGDKNNQEFQDFFESHYTKIKEDKHATFVIFSPTEEWDTVLAHMFGDDSNQMGRLSYAFRSFNSEVYNSTDLYAELPEGYQVQRISKETISKSPFFHEKYYTRFWGSTEQYLKYGFGYSVFFEGQIVCEGTSIFSGRHVAEIDIETHENHRGLGLAQLVAHLFIKHCLIHQLTPFWDCDAENIGSKKLAKKTGFDDPTPYSIFVKRKDSTVEMGCQNDS